MSNQKTFESLVSIVDGEPRAQSDAIAKGMRQQHASVIKLARKHIDSLNEFGLVRFQIRPRSIGKHGGGDSEIAMLNEQQATLLISMMRNTDSVIEFKVNLVKEFFRMRDALDRRDKNLWQQMQALIAQEVESKVRASFGSRLMLERKREIPYFREERQQIESQIQPSLLN
jgi:phage regulator Rha-like protein